MAFENLSYDERKRLRKEQLALNEIYLNEFAADLERKGISEKTIDQHLDNVRLFLNVYLPEKGANPMLDGCFLMDDYFGRYFIQRSRYIPVSTIRKNITSLKKFYKSMLESRRINAECYRSLLDDLKDGWPTWRETCWHRNEEFATAIERARRTAASKPTGCSACGSSDVAIVSNSGRFCKDCNNKLISDELGVKHFTDEGLHFFCPDDKCMPIRFEVEHLLLGSMAKWTAREVVDEEYRCVTDDYEGHEVTLLASAFDDPEKSRMALIEKMERHLKIKSLDIEKNVARPGELWSGCIQRGRDIITAAKRGVARLELGEMGGVQLIIDGYRYSDREFMQLISHAEGCNLFWEIKDASEDVPKYWLDECL